MATLTETATYDSGVYQLEVTDLNLAGASGVLNTPHKNLANRTAYLKFHVDSIEAGSLTGVYASAAHIGTGGGAHAAVVSGGASGFMTGADKAKLDGIAAGATVAPVTSVFGRTGAVVMAGSDVVASLGWNPVQQGTGVGQAANVVKIGYASSGSRLKATVDSTDLGNLVFDSTVISKLFPVSSFVGSNAINFTLDPCVIDFRSSTLGSGTTTTLSVTSTLTLTAPSGATLGTTSGVSARLLILAINNAGTVELAVTNIVGGNTFDESGTINTQAMTVGSSNPSQIYSTSARTGVTYRVVGFIDVVQAAAGAWASSPTKIQGVGGVNASLLHGFGISQTWQDVTGSRAYATTYTNTTGRPIAFTAWAGTTGPASTLWFNVNGVTVALTSGDTTNGGAIATPVVVVPVNATYSITNSGKSALIAWMELR